MTLSKKNIVSISITLILIFQVLFINLHGDLKPIQIDSLLSFKRDNYVEVLEKRFNELKQTNLYNSLKTNILFNNKTKIDVNFVWNEEDKIKYGLNDNNKSVSTFDISTFVNLYKYHQYIHKLYEHTRNTTILDSYISMTDTIYKISKDVPDSISESDIQELRDIRKKSEAYFKEMKTTEDELIEFDDKLLNLLKLNHQTYTNSKPNIEDLAKVEAEKFVMLINMLSKTENLYINIPKNKTDKPFIKFNTFVNMYDNLYELQKKLVKNHNEKVESRNFWNKTILIFLSLILIILVFYKENIHEES